MLFTSAVFNTLKKTLDAIVSDKDGGGQSSLVCNKWLTIEGMSDAWVDEMTFAGPGLAYEMSEGQEIPEGDMREGFLKRYIARKFGLAITMTDEVMEDSKYKDSFRAQKRCSAAMWKTADIDSTFMLIRAFNANFVGGDSQPLGSASHPMAHGGTVSNIMAVPMSPSVLALSTARTQLSQMPGHDGTIQGYEMKKVVYPPEQWAGWSELLNSMGHPDAGEFNRINVVSHDLKPEPVEVKYWNTTATNWAILTDAEDSLRLKFRRKPRSNSWMENGNETVKQSITARWCYGWTDWRGFYGVNA